MTTGWISLTFLVEKENAEPFSDWLLQEQGALSITVEDADAGTDKETPQFDEPTTIKDLWSNNRITALFEPDIDIAALEKHIQQQFGIIELLATENIDDEDWVTKTQSQFEPIKISSRLWIVPSWHDAPDADAINLTIDPGMAFGTGSHPTTKLCLQWLDANLSSQQSLLDYGCGSGILAIAAAKIGVPQTVGIDIDTQAVALAQKNAINNQTHSVFYTADEPHQISGHYFDVLVANILTNPLKMLASLLPAYLKENGTLILSGILAEQADDVINAYLPYLDLRVDAELEGWVRLTGQKR